MRRLTARWSIGASIWLDALALAASILLAGVHALYSRGDHNEEMYVAAGALLRTHGLYSQFAFLQAPGLPLLHAGLFALSGSEHLLLLARLHTWLWAALALTAAQLLMRRAGTGCRLLAPAATLALVTQRVFVSDVSEASNYMPALGATLLATLALSFAVDSNTGPQARQTWCVLSGVAAGAAASCKLNHVLSVAGLCVVVWLYRRRVQPGHWLAGVLLGLSPLLFYAARDFDGFWFGNVGYHLSNAGLLSGMQSPRVELAGKARQIWRIWREPQTLALSTFVVVGLLSAWRARRLRSERALTESERWVLALVACLFAAVLAALAPTPANAQYFAHPLAFVLLACVALAALLGRRWQQALTLICLAAILLTTGPSRKSLERLGKTTWPTRIERDANTLRALLTCTPERRVATLAPIRALEAGCGIYPELASGPFAYRVADLQPEELQRRLRLVGPEGVAALFAERPPDALLLGLEQRYESAFETYARQAGYVRQPKNTLRQGRLWLPRPTGASAQPSSPSAP